MIKKNTPAFLQSMSAGRALVWFSFLKPEPRPIGLLLKQISNSVVEYSVSFVRVTRAKARFEDACGVLELSLLLRACRS